MGDNGRVTEGGVKLVRNSVTHFIDGSIVCASGYNRPTFRASVYTAHPSLFKATKTNVALDVCPALYCVGLVFTCLILAYGDTLSFTTQNNIVALSSRNFP